MGKHRYIIDSDSAILVTVSTNLVRLLVKAVPYDLATQIDIPLSNITSYKITSVTSTQVGKPMGTTNIHLSDSADAPLFVNADDWNEREVAISFNSYDAADNLFRIIRAYRANKVTAENTAKLAQNSAKIAKNARKRVSKKIIEETEDEKSQIASMARQSLDDNDHVAEEQGNQPRSAQQVNYSSEFANAKTIASNATSLLIYTEQASASAQQPISKLLQGASQKQKGQSLERLQKNHDTVQGIPDTFEVNAGIELRMMDATAGETSQMLPPDGRLLNAKHVEEHSTSLEDISKNVHGQASQTEARRTSSALPDPNGTKTQSLKRRKLTQQPRDDYGELKNSGEIQGESKSRNAPSKLMTSKPINSSQTTKLQAKMPSKKQRVTSRDLVDKRTEQSQTNDNIVPEQDPYEMPASPIAPNRNPVSRTGEQAKAKAYKSRKNGVVTNGKETEKNDMKERITQAPQMLAQPKSRRAAAIHANTKLQGIDNSAPPSGAESRQANTQSKQAIHGPKDVAKENAGAASQHDSIETVQTADEIRPVSAAFVQVQDSIETLNDINKTLSKKQNTHRSTKNARRARNEKLSRDSGVGAKGVARGLEMQIQGEQDPRTTDDAGPMVLDPRMEVPDSVQERLPGEIPSDSIRPPDGREATQHGVQGGEADDALQVQEAENATSVGLFEDGQHNRKAERNEEMHGAQPVNEKSSEGNGGLSTLKQTGTGHGVKAALKEVEGQLGLSVPEHEQTSNNDISTPTIAKHLKAHVSSANRDPFSAKLNKLVKDVVITKERHPTRTVDASISKGEDGTMQEISRKSLHQSRLQQGQSNIGTSDAHSPNSHTLLPTTRLKRKAEGELRDFPNKVRKDVNELEGTTDISANKTPPIATRKTAIISFSTSGPRNQGTASKKKDKKYGTQASGARKLELPGAPKKTIEPPEMTYVAPVPLKEPQQLILQKVVAETGYIAVEDEEHTFFGDEHQAPPTILQNRYSQQGKVDGLDMKPSSQTTRVNHNGSPMPVRHPTNEPAVVSNTTSQSKITYPKRQSGQDMRSDEESLAGDSEDGDPYDDEDKDEGLDDGNALVPTLPSRNPVSQSSMHQLGAYNWTSIAKNSKQIPSSPHEPSATAALPPHHIQDGGQIINASTNVPVVPSPPQDPFVAEAGKPSSFMRLLRDASESHLKKRPEAAVSEKTKRVRKTTLQSPNDPDKTLVEPSFSRRRITSDPSKRGTSSSSSGDTSEEETSQTLIQEAEDTPAKWNKALLPHQENTMDVLNEITHRLLAHMIKGEDALLDLVQDFKNSGTKMIDQIEKELQQGIVARAAATAALEKKVTDLFQLTAIDLKASEGQILGRATQVETDLDANQLSLMASIEAALALSRN